MVALFPEMPAHAVEERQTGHENRLQSDPAVVDFPRLVQSGVGGDGLDGRVVDVLQRVFVVAEVG